VNYSRVVVFSVGLYLLLVALWAIATYIVGADQAILTSMPFLIAVHFIGFSLSLSVYIYLAYKQTTKPYQHAVCVASFCWLINLSVNVLLYIFLELPFVPLALLFPALLNVIEVLLGTLLGIKLRQKRELSLNAI